MAADNHAQSSAITEISVAVGTMDQSTQQNAAMVEETSAAARNFTNEVQALAEQASHFRIHKRGYDRPNNPHIEAMKLKAVVSIPHVKKLGVAVALTLNRQDDWNEF